ncbi:MAG TPA: hypothetical protein VGC65_10690 [Bacteroidia bacterium]|jgi:hypothetical protein
MKKRSIAIPLLAATMAASAQEPVKAPANIPDMKKNELSINAVPVFKMLSNTGPSPATRFSFTYKRYLNEKSTLRFSVKADRIDLAANKYNPWNEHILLGDDTVITKERRVSPAYFSPHLNIGYERLFGRNKLKWFYGADLSVGYARSRSFIESKTLIKDTTQGAGGWIESMTNQSEILSTTTKKITSLGLSPFFGLKYPLSKRLSVSAQVGVDMVYRNEDRTETTGSTVKKYRVSSFDFNQDTGFLNDISLIYKF